jgi:hypothetical protein
MRVLLFADAKFGKDAVEDVVIAGFPANFFKAAQGIPDVGGGQFGVNPPGSVVDRASMPMSYFAEIQTGWL